MAYTKTQILVVDDDREICEFVKTVLKTELQIQVAEVNSGPQALEYIEHSQPGLVLLDILIPDMDGFEIAKRLRFKDIPFIAMSSLVVREHIERLNSLGSFSFLAKPMSMDQLLGTVISALSHIARIQAIQQHARFAQDIGTARGAISAFLSIHPDQAFDVLNEMARDQHGNVKDTAQIVNQFLDFLGRANAKLESQKKRAKKRVPVKES